MKNSDFTFETIQYVRPDLDALAAQIDAITADVTAATSFDAVKALMHRRDDVMRDAETMVTVAHIRNTLDTRDSFYEDEMAFLDNALPALQAHMVAYQKALVASPFRNDISREFGPELLTAYGREIAAFNETLIPYMQEEAALCTEYQKLIASAAIPFDGQTLNLYGIQKYFEHEDRAVRKEAFRLYSEFFSSHEADMERIFDRLVEIRTAMGKAAGFSTYTPLGYLLQGRSDYGQEEVASFRAQVKEVLVPLCEKLYEAQAKRIGVDTIMAYDENRVFPDGNAQPIGGVDELVAQAVKMYHDISPETGEFIDFMTGHHLMDLANRPGKAATGYMTELPAYEAPFVFSCFNGTIGDVGVLSHELGHAFAGYMATRSQPISEYTGCSTDIAEIHSMSMEQFCYPYAEMYFGDGADKYRFQHLQEAITFVPFGVAVDEFQHVIYENPGLTPKERTAVWHDLELKYMPWRKYDNDPFMERGGYWYHKIHIFLYPMYYINYTLTTMGAMEFKKRRETNPEEAWNDYLALCKAGGSMSYKNLLRLANLSIPFEAGSVERACGYARDILLHAIQKEQA